MAKKDYCQVFINLEGVYNASVELVGNMAIITYEILGQGSVIIDSIREILGDREYSIKLLPNECQVEVVVYD